MQNNKRLSYQVFSSLVSIFESNKWEVLDDSARADSLFTRFCERLSILETQEQLLVLDLIKRFVYIQGGDYTPSFVDLLDRLSALSTYKATKRFFLLPLKKENDSTKSGDIVLYTFREPRIMYNNFFNGFVPDYIVKPKDIKSCYFPPDSTIVLLDDFIGSGDTAVNAINSLKRDIGLQKNKFNILLIALIGLNEGINRVKKETKIDVQTYIQVNKGISDYYTGLELSNHVRTMTSIEGKLNVTTKFRFGYKKSEALVSLMRAPNNTFPVFWLTSKNHSLAPFAR